MHFPWFWLGLALVIIGVIIFLIAANYYNSSGATQSQKNTATVWMWIAGFVFVIGLIIMIWNFVLAAGVTCATKEGVAAYRVVRGAMQTST